MPPKPDPPAKKSAFVHKLYGMLCNKKLLHLIWWTESSDSNTFAVYPSREFADALLEYFKHDNVALFVRQLHMYGFHKVLDLTQNHHRESPVWEFRHSLGKFRKDDESLLVYIKRRLLLNTLRALAVVEPDYRFYPYPVYGQVVYPYPMFRKPWEAAPRQRVPSLMYDPLAPEERNDRGEKLHPGSYETQERSSGLPSLPVGGVSTMAKSTLTSNPAMTSNHAMTSNPAMTSNHAMTPGSHAMTPGNHAMTTNIPAMTASNPAMTTSNSAMMAPHSTEPGPSTPALSTASRSMPYHTYRAPNQGASSTLSAAYNDVVLPPLERYHVFHRSLTPLPHTPTVPFRPLLPLALGHLPHLPRRRLQTSAGLVFSTRTSALLVSERGSLQESKEPLKTAVAFLLESDRNSDAG